MSELIRLTVENPSKSLGIKPPQIEVGQRVKAQLFNPNAKRVVNNTQSLYNGEELSGEVIRF